MGVCINFIPLKVYLSHDLYTAWTYIETQSMSHSSCSFSLLYY